MARPRRRTTLQTFGDRVRALRMHEGMSQEALGFEAGMHPTYVSGIERGVRNISLRNIVAIAAALKVNPAELVTDLKPDR